MSLPNPGPGESAGDRGAGPIEDAVAPAGATADMPVHPAQDTPAASPQDTLAGTRRSDRSTRGLPGARVVAVATVVVIVAALVEVLVSDTIGLWTGVTLVVVSVVASLVTRAGDRSLPAMMPPLAFLAATLIAGQALLPTGKDPLWVREALMLLDVLGANAVWVVAATVLSVTISTIRHLVDHARDRRAR